MELVDTFPRPPKNSFTEKGMNMNDLSTMSAVYQVSKTLVDKLVDKLSH